MQISGIIIVDKEAGFTSFDVVAKLRGILGMKKIGHAGTLDPMATGVLPIFLGEATKAIQFLENHDKRYRARFILGIATDTQDTSGTILKEKAVSASEAEVRATCLKFRGEQMQLPPMFSAVKIDGQRLYQLARKGKEIERPTRPINIKELEFMGQVGENEYEIDVLCSGGTYIRTLAADIGQSLGCGAALSYLRRTEACGYGEGEALRLAEISAMVESGDLRFARKTETAFTHFERVDVEKKIGLRLLNGQRIPIEEVFASGDAKTGVFAVFHKDKLLCLAENVGENLLKAKKTFFKGDL